MKDHVSILLILGACSGAQAFANRYPSAKAAWTACNDPDWLLWLLMKLAPKEALILAADMFEIATSGLDDGPRLAYKEACEQYRKDLLQWAGVGYPPEIKEPCNVTLCSSDAPCKNCKRRKYLCAECALPELNGVGRDWAQGLSISFRDFVDCIRGLNLRSLTRNKLCTFIRARYPEPPIQKLRKHPYYQCSTCGIVGVRMFVHVVGSNIPCKLEHQECMKLVCARHTEPGLGYSQVYPKGWKEEWLNTYPDAIPISFDPRSPEGAQVKRVKRSAYHAERLKHDFSFSGKSFSKFLKKRNLAKSGKYRVLVRCRYTPSDEGVTISLGRCSPGMFVSLALPKRLRMFPRASAKMLMQQKGT